MAATSTVSSSPSLENPWSKLYLIADYKKDPRPQHVLNHVLHYLVGLRQPSATISGWLANIRKNEGEAGVARRLTKADQQRHLLTPLMLALALQQEDTANVLVDAGKASGCVDSLLSQADQNGFTALHHAALGMPSLLQPLQRLLKQTHPKKHPSSQNYSLSDLRHFTSSEEAALPHSAANLFLEDPEGHQTPWKDIPEATRSGVLGFAEYRDVARYAERNPMHHHALWAFPLDEDEDPFTAAVQPSAAQVWQKRAPRLVLKQCPELGGETPQFGLFAGESLRCGALIAPYTGVPVFPAEESFEEAMAAFSRTKTDATSHCVAVNGYVLDGARVSSAASRVNEGVPNCVMRAVRLGGFPVQPALIVSHPDGIAKGDEIRWFYGAAANYHWWTQRVTQRGELKVFFKHGLGAVLGKMESGTMGLVQAHYARNRVHHAFCTPKVLVFLHAAGVVTADEWLKYLIEDCLFGYQHGLQDFLNSEPLDATILRALLISLEEYSKGLQERIGDERTLKAFAQWVVERIDGISVFQAVRAFQWVLQQDAPFGFEEWQQRAGALEEAVQGYDWFSDEMSPLKTKNALNLWLGYLKARTPSEEFEQILMKGLWNTVMSYPDAPEKEVAFPIFYQKLRDQGIDEYSLSELIQAAKAKAKEN